MPSSALSALTWKCRSSHGNCNHIIFRLGSRCHRDVIDAFPPRLLLYACVTTVLRRTRIPGAVAVSLHKEVLRGGDHSCCVPITCRIIKARGIRRSWTSSSLPTQHLWVFRSSKDSVSRFDAGNLTLHFELTASRLPLSEANNWIWAAAVVIMSQGLRSPLVG